MGTEWTDEDDDDWANAPTGIPEISAAAQPVASAPPMPQCSGGHANAKAASTVAATCAPLGSALPMPAKAATPVFPPHADKPEHFPAFISRSALFKAGRTTKVIADACAEDVKAQGCAITFSGPELNMRDKAVLEIAIKIAKENNVDLSQAFQISLRDFIERLGEKDFCAERLRAIWASLERLAKARISFRTDEGASGVGSFIATAVKQAGKCYLRLNADFAETALLHDKQFRINGGRRNRLSSSLAQWLHDFYSTHTVAKDHDFKYLRDLCGFPGAARNFPGQLREAMAELAAQAPGLVAAYSISGTTRKSDAWTLSVTRGQEPAQFVMPKAAAKQPWSGVQL